LRIRYAAWCCAVILAGAAATRAHASPTAGVQSLLATERFAEADRRAQMLLDNAPEKDAQAAPRRLEALNLLLDSAIAQRSLTDDINQTRIEQATSLTRAQFGENSKRLAKLVAADASRHVQLAQEGRLVEGNPNESADALCQRSVELLEQG